MKSDDNVDGKLKSSSNNNNLFFFVKFFSFCKKFFKKISKNTAVSELTSIENEVAEIIEEHDPKGVHVSTEERNMLYNIFGINERKVDDIMVNRSDIFAVEENIGFEELRKLIVEKEHTRVPVYKSSMDNVSGFLHAKDLFSIISEENRTFCISDFMREALFVPPSMKILDLLVKMRKRRTHIAIVLDEYGGTEGLVTLEDIVEEIVGDIEDEHDEVEVPEVLEIRSDTIEVNARVGIEVIEEKFNVQLKVDKEEDFDSVGGFVFSLLERVPKKGEIIRHSSGIELKVIESSPSKIHRLLIVKK